MNELALTESRSALWVPPTAEALDAWSKTWSAHWRSQDDAGRDDIPTGDPR